MSLDNPRFHAAPRQPSRHGLLREWRTAADVGRMSLALLAPLFPRARNPQTVIVLPGFGGDDRWTWPLRRALRRAGHQAEGWGLGRNLAGIDIRHTQEDIPAHWQVEARTRYRGEGSVIVLTERMLARVRQRHAETGHPIALVGWSLGGYIAREIARDAPECVSRVITLGSPVIGGPKYSLAAELFRRRGMDLDWIEREIARREARPIPVPITAIVSPTDGIVDPAATIDHASPNVRHVAIDAPHIGLVFNPEVWRQIFTALDADETA